MQRHSSGMNIWCGCLIIINVDIRIQSQAILPRMGFGLQNPSTPKAAANRWISGKMKVNLHSTEELDFGTCATDHYGCHRAPTRTAGRHRIDWSTAICCHGPSHKTNGPPRWALHARSTISEAYSSRGARAKSWKVPYRLDMIPTIIHRTRPSNRVPSNFEARPLRTPRVPRVHILSKRRTLDWAPPWSFIALTPRRATI